MKCQWLPLNWIQCVLNVWDTSVCSSYFKSYTGWWHESLMLHDTWLGSFQCDVFELQVPMTKRSVTLNCRLYFVSSSMVKYRLGNARQVSLVSFHCICVATWWSLSSHAMIHTGNIGGMWDICILLNKQCPVASFCKIYVSWKRWCW